MAMRVVPPGGFAGFNQMTVASRAALSDTEAGRRNPRAARRTYNINKKFRRKKARQAKKAARKTKRSSIKFGSPAWQKKYKVGRFAKKR